MHQNLKYDLFVYVVMFSCVVNNPTRVVKRSEPFDDAKVKAIAAALWTDDAKAAYKKWVEDNRTPS